ncbi:MAG: KH domain-containing protein [Bacilli bacterium]|nr:KH domain-containing protein [Bacilli bacterium]
MNYEKIIHALIDEIVEEPESVLIRVTESDNGKDVVIIIASEKEDTARLIGRHGTIANALREVISIAGKNENKHIHLKFESFGEEIKED